MRDRYNARLNLTTALSCSTVALSAAQRRACGGVELAGESSPPGGSAVSGSSNPICIYCGSSGPFSQEHAIPFCLGEFQGFATLPDRVCARCNNSIGGLERHFCRGASPESFFRRIVGVQGRKSHKPHNPFTEGVGERHPIDARIKDPVSGDTLLWEFVGRNEVRQVPQVVLSDESGGSRPIRITPTMTPEQLLASIHAAGLQHIDGYVVADPGEYPWVERLLAAIGKRMTEADEQRGPLHFSEWVNVGLEVGPEYFRAIAKIGFHYYLTASPALRGSEKELQPLRDFVLKGGDIDSFVEQRKLIILHEIPRAYGHIALAMWDQSHVEVYLQFFLGPDNPRPVTYCVKMAGRVPELSESHGFVGHLFANFPDGPQGHFRGQAMPLRTGG